VLTVGHEPPALAAPQGTKVEADASTAAQV
jgi:hypothetical protein